jgi:hypothetical protein
VQLAVSRAASPLAATVDDVVDDVDDDWTFPRHKAFVTVVGRRSNSS